MSEARNTQPWYEVGEDIRTALTMEEAMKQGFLDFEVQKVQVFIPEKDNTDEDGKPRFKEVTNIADGMQEVPGAFATRRLDTGIALGVVGSKYRVVQNTDAFALFNPLLEDGSLRLDMAGCLGQNGEKIWVLAEVGDPVLLVEGDELKKYILLLNSHDGSTSLRVLNTPVSVERGTTQMADSEHSLAIRHTQSAQDRLNQARHIVARSLAFYENFVDAAHELIAKKLRKIDVDKFIESMFPAKLEDGEIVFSTRALNQMQVIRDLYEGEEIVATRGTAWALYNAVTEFVDHHRTPSDSEAQKYRRLQSISIGSGAEMKKKAFNNLIKV